MKLVYCFALMKIPVHRMSGYQLLTSLPTQLITDVDSMPLCLAFCPITSGFFVFTPWIKCSFVQGLWCIWNFMYCEKILCPSRLVILRLFFLCAPLCTAKQRNTQKLSLKVSNGYKPFSVRSRSGKRPFPHMQRLVVQNYLNLDRDIAIECICVGPSECFSFQPCSFLSLYPASCLL